jgi:hypothetical protein
LRFGRIRGEHSFFGEPGKQHSDRCHVLFDRRRPGLALKRLDIRRDRDGLNIFEVLITGTQEKMEHRKQNSENRIRESQTKNTDFESIGARARHRQKPTS